MQTGDNREKEVKFFISDPLRIRDHVLAHGARLQKERLFEMNLRFDTASRPCAPAIRYCDCARMIMFA